MRPTVLVGLAMSFMYLAGCQSEKEDPDPDCSASDLTLVLEEKTQAACGASDGTATVQASGGEGDYTYSLSGSDQENGAFTGLAAGNHTFTVTDENGCTTDLNVVIETMGGVSIESIETTKAGCDESAATITVTATEGVEPYQYKLDNGAFQDQNVFEDVAAGTHTVVVSDDQGCEFSETVEVLSGISLSQHIVPIISENCTLASCHGGSVSPNLESNNSIINRAQTIKTVTGNGTMPKEGSLTQEEIDMIACWVDDGAPEN